MATIIMESARVIEACTATITRIEKYRKDSDEESIQRIMGQTWHKWFKPYRPTREQAIKYLVDSDNWSFPCIRGYGTLGKAKKLLKLAQLGDPVMLNQDDVDDIF